MQSRKLPADGQSMSKLIFRHLEDSERDEDDLILAQLPRDGLSSLVPWYVNHGFKTDEC